MMWTRRQVINGCLVAAVALTTLTPAGNAAVCCCPDHKTAAPCEMSCGPVGSPDELQAVVPSAAHRTVTVDGIVPSFAVLPALPPADTLERFTAPHDESPPKRYLRNRVLRL